MAERRHELSGDIDLAVADRLRSKLLVLVNATDDDLVLDCDELKFIDSTGIDVLVSTRRQLESRGRSMRVVNLRGTARRPFEILGLTEYLGIAEPEPA